MAARIRNYERDLRRLREARVKFGDELMAHPGVHGMGIGLKKVDGKKGQTLALVVHVHNKVDKEELEEGQIVPARLKFYSRNEGKEITVQTDVVEQAIPVPEIACGACATDFEDRIRPTPGGFSIGLQGVAGGTLGGWVWDNVSDQLVMISNEHVLGSGVGDEVIQPSATDGGAFPADDLGRVVRSGTLDVAIASAVEADDILAEIECSTPGVFEITDAIVEMEVEKVGQTTGLTCGIVELIDYNSGHYGSIADLWIDGDGNDFSQGGDSGSLYMEKTNPDGNDWKRVVGIHWGGSGDDGVGHPIRAIFTDASVTTVCSGIIETILENLGRDADDEAEGKNQPFGRKRRSRRGLARDMEKRLREFSKGKEIAELLQTHRVGAVAVLLNGDGRRAARSFLEPLVSACVTTDELLECVFSAKDIDRAHRLVDVAVRLRPELKEPAQVVERLLRSAEGKSIGAVVGAPSKQGKGRRPRPE